jgi:hypothetical protein|tara:strand:- start:15 stop:278 length:264 start_codon:yes stop_codon:yes gene_type:complete
MSLPEVTETTIEIVLRDFNNDKRLFGRLKWTKIALENKHFFLSISDTAEKMSEVDKIRAESFLRGAFLAYTLLDAQEEVDELEKNWG